jgi:gliding motility-associated-like protein
VDLDAGSAPVLINPLPLDMTALQLAVDGRIYVVRYKKSFMGVIENPNRPGTACNFDDQGLSLNTSMALIGLPDMIQSYFNIPAINYDTKCQGDDTYFTLTNDANIDSVKWNFGDPGSGIANSDTALHAIHKYSNSGTYNVNVTEYYNSQSFITPATVVINPLPPKSFLSLGDGLPGIDSIPILPGSEINLDGGNFMKTYFWQNGSTAQTYKASEAGYYNVTIEDTNCCVQSDTIKLYLLDLIVPSAFSPNHDGLNDRFRVKGPTQGIDNYQFYIYNRWGQLLWQSNNFGDSWDGTFNGAECPMGVYTWVMRFGVSGDLLKVDKIIKRGVITLVK